MSSRGTEADDSTLPFSEKLSDDKSIFEVIITQFYEIATPFFIVDWLALGIMAVNFLLINVVFFSVGWVALHKETSSGQNIDYASGLFHFTSDIDPVILSDDSVDNNGQDIPSSGSFSCSEARKLHAEGAMDCVYYELARCCIAMSWAKTFQMLISLWVKRQYPDKIQKALASSCWSKFLGITLLFPCMTLLLAPIFYALFKGVWDPTIDGHEVSLAWCFYVTILCTILQFVFVGLLIWRSVFCDITRATEAIGMISPLHYVSMEKEQQVADV